MDIPALTMAFLLCVSCAKEQSSTVVRLVELKGEQGNQSTKGPRAPAMAKNSLRIKGPNEQQRNSLCFETCGSAHSINVEQLC